MVLPFVLLAGGIILLVKGADWLVEGASALAKRLNVSDLVIGLTIVSFGTSAPELLVNILASLRDSADLAIGNILGSNISNTLLILGATAAVFPLAIKRSTVLREIPFCLLASLMILVMVQDAWINGASSSELNRSDGLLALGFFAVFLHYTFVIRHSRKDEIRSSDHRPLWLVWGLILLGMLGLALGGQITVDSAQVIAFQFNLSEALVGLTLVAIGTSLPELSTSLVAAFKKKADISVGNIVGSNIFNLLFVLAVSAVIKPLPFQDGLTFDLWVVVLTALLLFFMVHNGNWHRRLFFWWKQKEYILNRYEGYLMLVLYFSYIGFIAWRG